MATTIPEEEPNTGIRPAEANLHDQTQILPKKRLIPVFSSLSLSMMASFMDQNGINVLLPTIAKDLHAHSTITWAGTSSLIAGTVFQVLYGRLSDLFGRKNLLLGVLAMLAISDLACSFSPNATTLYVFRAFAGVANGGVSSLTSIIVSDIVTIQERGKYQGINGAMVGVGSGLGPLIAAGLDLHATWRALFWLLTPLIVLSFGMSWWLLPSNMPKCNFKETVKKIDFLGLITISVAIILLLIPISNAGHHGLAWSSPTVITMLVIGCLNLVAFVIIERCYARLPMIPLGLFRVPSVAAMLVQSVLLGAVYYSYTYFISLYLQNVRGLTPLKSALLQLPLVVSHSTCSVVAGLLMSRFKRFKDILWAGFGLWTLGSATFAFLKDRTPFVAIAFMELVLGAGTGLTFQPTLVALQAQCPKSQRAVVTSARNFLRSCGGAIGLAISSTILSHSLNRALPRGLRHVAESTFALPDLTGYGFEDIAKIKRAYLHASHMVFLWLVPMTAVCLLLNLMVKDKSLAQPEEPIVTPTEEPTQPMDEVSDTPMSSRAASTVVTSKQPSIDEHRGRT